MKGNTDWNIGAFVTNSSGDSNFGWGNYNESNGIIEGNKIDQIQFGLNAEVNDALDFIIDEVTRRKT